VSLDPSPLDLHHQSSERVIGCYLLETPDGPVLHDCGPTSCLERLEEALREHGVELSEVRHLLLSHIHLDHAGAAGVLVRRHPQVQVHVSSIGAPHLVDPARLEASARRLYGETFDPLWGELAPVPRENIQVVGASVLGLECFPAPGHASHHVCYLDEDGTLYAGDAAGVRIEPDSTVLPPTPPPEFDPHAWDNTITEIERRAPERLALIHFGVASDPAQHLEQLRSRIDEWVALVDADVDERAFSATVRAALVQAGSDADAYERAMPFWQSYAGLKRYRDKHRAA
jgi:glyoxylase-like metal-dependent hydrolase (beta-lactamase superfamily II)